MSEPESNNAHAYQPIFRFQLRHLFYVISLIASGLAITPGTIVLSIVVLAVWGLIFANIEHTSKIGWALVVFLLCACMVGALLPPVVQVREASRRARCMNNVKQIVLAILNFESANGHFPTNTEVVTPDGQRLVHSWRIHLLPFLEQSAAYKRYDFNEPWNGPNNSKLATTVDPYCWRCPSHDLWPRTPYRLVNGPGTAFEADRKLTFSDVRDGSSNTIAVIEDHGNPVHWMQPDILTSEEATDVLNSNGLRLCDHKHEHLFSTVYMGSTIGFLDGSVDFCYLNADVVPEMFTIDDGQLFDLTNRFQGSTVRQWHYGKCIAAGVYLALILLPVLFLWRKTSAGLGEGLATPQTSSIQ